jgi:hypothetical protein
MIHVDKTDAHGRVTWCATFAHSATAKAFVDRQNSIYAGYLKFDIRPEPTPKGITQ